MSAERLPSPNRPPAGDPVTRIACVIVGGILCGLAVFVIAAAGLLVFAVNSSAGGAGGGDGLDGVVEGAGCCGSFTGVIAAVLGGWAIWRFTPDRNDPPR